MRTPATAPSASGNSQPAAGYVCRHIHTLGSRCGSPCLRGEEFCYFHHTNHRAPLAPITDPELLFAGPHTILDVPSLEDRPAIQLALLELTRRIGNNTIDPKRANSLLRAYHIASVNLAREERAAISGRMSGRTLSKSERDLPVNRLPQPIPIPQTAHIVQDVEFSPTLGPLAPVLEYGLPEPEEEQEPSLASRIYSWLDAPPPPEPVPLEKRPYDFDTLQLLRRTLATTTNPETATRIRKALEEEALLPGHNLHIQACAEPAIRSPLSVPRSRTKRHRTTNNEQQKTGNEERTTTRAYSRLHRTPSRSNLGLPSIPQLGQNSSRRSDILVQRRTGQTPRTRAASRILQDSIPRYHNQNGPPLPPRPALRHVLSRRLRRPWLPHQQEGGSPVRLG